jgi:hypothetical protein
VRGLCVFGCGDFRVELVGACSPETCLLKKVPHRIYLARIKTEIIYKLKFFTS